MEKFYEITKKEQTGAARAGILSFAATQIATPAFIPQLPPGPKRTYTPQELGFWGAKALRVPVWPILRSSLTQVLKQGGLEGFLGAKNVFFAYPGVEWDTHSSEFNARRVAAEDSGLVFECPPDWDRAVLSPEDFAKAQMALNSQAVELLAPLDPHASQARDWAMRGIAVLAPVYVGQEVKKPRVYLQYPLRNENSFISAVDGLVANCSEIEESPHTAPIPLHAKSMKSPQEILDAVSRGADTFDASFPYENAREKTFHLMPRSGESFRMLAIDDEGNKDNSNTPDPSCGCYTCRTYELGELYAMASQEPGDLVRLCGIHNTRFVFDLAEKIRRTLTYGSFEEWRQSLRVK